MRYLFFIFTFVSCSSYEVIQEVGDNEYHMYRKGKVEIIESKEKLEIGKSYNIKKVQKK